MTNLAFSIIIYLFQIEIPKPYIDRLGNLYYRSPTGKIYTPGNPEITRYPPTPDTLNFYYIEGITLYQKGFKVEGLTLLKSIIYMPQTTKTIKTYQEKVTKFLNMMRLKDGNRFQEAYNKAHLIMYMIKKRVHIKNLKYRYYFSIPMPYGKFYRYSYKSAETLIITTVKPEKKKHYLFSKKKKIQDFEFISIFSMQFKESYPKKLTDFLYTINTITTPKVIQQKYKKKQNSFYLYKVKLKLQNKTLYGYEAIKYKNKYGYVILLASTKKEYKKLYEIYKEILNTFKIY